MNLYSGQQAIGQLEKRKGGYFYLAVPGQVVAQWPQGRQTRLICQVAGGPAFRCGLNHLGNGDFFLILSTAYVKALGISVGQPVQFSLSADPDPLGVDMPEVLTHLLAQDEELNTLFQQLSLGKRRSLIYQIAPMKNLDLQVAKCVKLIHQLSRPSKSRSAS